MIVSRLQNQNVRNGRAYVLKLVDRQLEMQRHFLKATLFDTVVDACQSDFGMVK